MSGAYFPAGSSSWQTLANLAGGGQELNKVVHGEYFSGTLPGNPRLKTKLGINKPWKKARANLLYIIVPTHTPPNMDVSM